MNEPLTGGLQPVVVAGIVVDDQEAAPLVRSLCPNAEAERVGHVERLSSLCSCRPSLCSCRPSLSCLVSPSFAPTSPSTSTAWFWLNRPPCAQVKKVLGISVALFVLGVVGQLSQFFELELYGFWNILGLLVALFLVALVPGCGYFGAKKRNKTLMSAFTCCNGFSVCLSITYIIVLFVLLSVVNGDFELSDGTHTTIKAMINEGLPQLQDCCAELQEGSCKFATDGSCDWCSVAAVGGEMLPAGDGRCPKDEADAESSDADWSSALVQDLDGSASGGDTKQFCMTADDCDGITDLDSDKFKVTDALFWVLAVTLLFIWCLPALLGCVWGWQLTKHPMIAEGALADSPYLSAQVGGK